MQLEGSRAVRNINDRFTATMTNRVRIDTWKATQNAMQAFIQSSHIRQDTS